MKSFLQGKRTLAVPALKLPPGLSSPQSPARVASPRAVAARSEHEEHTGEPHVEVVKEGDKVVRLVVTCGCGERIEIECLYPVGS